MFIIVNNFYMATRRDTINPIAHNTGATKDSRAIFCPNYSLHCAHQLWRDFVFLIKFND